MQRGAAASFGAQLKTLREKAGFTQEELATIAGLSVHAISALERGERRRPHVETVRALSAALDLSGATRDGLLASTRAPARDSAIDELSRGSLPLAPTALFGREADVEALRHWVAEPTARLITLVGPGGVGKTRLALELARVMAEQASTRVVFVPLATIREPVFVGSAIAEALGMADLGAEDLPLRVRLACGNDHTWIVLDNFEQVLDAAAALKGSDAWAARILGIRDAVAERTGAMLVDRSVHDLRAHAERDVRARLGDDRWTRAYAAGRVTPIDSLIKDIDRDLHQTPPRSSTRGRG
jgi:transcriptional regulator with XRE-family HTH domain